MRALVIVVRLLPFLLAFVRDRKRFLLLGRGATRSGEHHRRRARRLIRTLAELGPTWIKLAQVFAARADIVPEPYLSAFATLTDQVPPLAPGVAERVVRESLGQDAAQLFEQFDRKPLAAASLGQVHRATYKGRAVVVKILRPGVEQVVRQDLDVAFRLLYLANIFAPGHQVRAISAIVSEFARRIADELDFREESRNAEILRRNFRDEPRVVVPEVVGELTRQQVLVLEYVEGTRVDRLQDRLAAGELRLDDVMRLIVEAYVQMMLQDGVFHADPHPGNLLIDAEGRLVLLDFGMVLQLEQETRSRLIRTMIAAVRQDVDGVINGMYALGVLAPETDRGTVHDAAVQLMSIAQKDETSPRQIQQIVEKVLQTFYDWPLMLPENLVYFGRAGVLVEGIGHRYDPNFNLVPIGKPLVEKYMGRLLEGVAGESKTRLLDWGNDVRDALRYLPQLVRRIEREEMRVRWHPRDAGELKQFLAQGVRRLLLALLAFTSALISTLIWLGTRSWVVLVLGLLFAFGLFSLTFLLPSHLFSNPLRRRRDLAR